MTKTRPATTTARLKISTSIIDEDFIANRDHASRIKGEERETVMITGDVRACVEPGTTMVDVTVDRNKE